VSSTDRLVGRLSRPSRRRLAWIAVAVDVQLVLVVAYYAVGNAVPRAPRYALYGVVWVTVGGYVLLTAEAHDAAFRDRRRAVAVAAGYFGLLAVTGGLVGTGLGDAAMGLRVAWLPPGWGPAVVYAGPHLQVALQPALLLGYAALARLVYGALCDASAAGVAGLAGLFSCVSCTWPVLAGLAGAGIGPLSTTVLGLSYDISTAVFLLTVALLRWRPGLGG
jgi:hypothetical protein